MNYDAWKTACPPEYLFTPADLAAEVGEILRRRGLEVEGKGAHWAAWGGEDWGVEVRADDDGVTFEGPRDGDLFTVEAEEVDAASLADRVEALLSR